MCKSLKQKNFVQLDNFIICLEDISSIRKYEVSDEKKRIILNNQTRDIIVSNDEADFIKEQLKKYANSFNTYIELSAIV